MKINQAIRALRPSRGSLVYILHTDSGMVIVDTGSEPEAASVVVSYVRDRLHTQPEKIKYVFLTHWHGDHAGAAEKIREMTGARIICGQEDAGLLDGTADIEVFWNTPMPRSGLSPFMQMVCAAGYRMMKANTGSLAPEIIVGEGPAPFDPEWTVLHLPGHTPGSCGLWSPRQRILFAGDTLLGIGKKIMPPVSFLIQDTERLYRSWVKLRALGPIEWILPGHFTPLRWGKTLELVPAVRRLARQAEGL